MRFQVLVDRAERVQKCTILPLADRSDFDIIRFARGRPIAALTGDLLLHHEGESLAVLGPRLAGSVRVLAAVDCTWRHLTPILQRIAPPLPALARVPEGFRTAYPRRNKEDKDPTDGLATIEALFIAAAFLGHWDETLLARYHFGSAFLAANAATFAAYKVAPALGRT